MLQRILRFAVFSILVSVFSGGCGPDLDAGTDGLQSADKSSKVALNVDQVYPVGRSVQFERVENAHSEHQESAEILNAVAYARYLAELLGDGRIGRSADTAEIARVIAHYASESGISIGILTGLGDLRASNAAYESYAGEIHHDALSGTRRTELSRQGKTLLNGRVKLQACVGYGFEPAQCCSALAWSEALRNIDGTAASYQSATAALLDEQRTAVASGTKAEIQPFNQSAIRAWLTYCGPVLGDAPRHIADFKSRFGNYHADPNWISELHPISPAKQAGRRIMRRVLADGTWVSIAESIDDDCGVRETETIVRAPGVQAQFWVFDRDGYRVDHAYFPTRRINEDAIRFAPNSCMGCHYTLDTRRFDVTTPSFEALNLQLFETPDGPVWRDHTHCSNDDDVLVYHKVPTVGP